MENQFIKRALARAQASENQQSTTLSLEAEETLRVTSPIATGHCLTKEEHDILFRGLLPGEKIRK